MGAIKTLFQCNHMDMAACFYANKLWWWMHIHPISEITSIKLILSGKYRGECRRNWVFSSAKLSPQGDTVQAGHTAGSTDCSHVSEISCDISVTGSIGEVVQSRRWPLLGPSPGWKRLLALSHLRHYQDTMLNRRWPHGLSTWNWVRDAIIIRDGRL